MVSAQQSSNTKLSNDLLLV